jgi:hypothetical protein
MAVKGPLGLGDVPRGKCKALPIKETFLAPHSTFATRLSYISSSHALEYRQREPRREVREPRYSLWSLGLVLLLRRVYSAYIALDHRTSEPARSSDKRMWAEVIEIDYGKQNLQFQSSKQRT